MSKALRKNDVKILNDIEHCLLRPGMYIGSPKEELIQSYIYEDNKIVQKEIPQIPGLLKLFDEIVMNSIDEAIRTNFKYSTKIKITTNYPTITIEDNGRGLPIEYNEELKCWTPEIIFTHLKAGSNFDDETKGNVAGQNGVGGSLAAIYSNYFKVETANGNQAYSQEFENHTQIKRKPKLKDSKDNYTVITYTPNMNFFAITEEATSYLDILYAKRIKDLAFAYPEVQFTFNKEKISASNLKAFLKQIHEVYECNEVENGRIGLFYSDTEFQQMSFVNGCYTSRGGTHIDYISGKIVDHLRTYLQKKHKVDVKPIDIKSKLFLLLAIRMQAPAFDSQTKERLVSPNHFKDLIDSMLTKKFLDSITKNEEIILPIVEAYKLKQQVKDNLELKKMNQNKKKVRIDKYFPAIKQNKFLLLCEGDSATGGIQAALGRDFYSYFSLKGKPLNALEADMKKIKDNDEFKNVATILNLDLGSDYQNLTHDMIVCAQDADLDGQHIMALLLSFFKRFTPTLIKEGKIGYLRTPLYYAKKKNSVVKYFFTTEEYKEFETKNPNHGLHFNYVKGLGTWEAEDLRYLFNSEGIEHFIKPFEFDDTTFDMIDNWMSTKTVEYRKNSLRGREFNIDAV